jgi:hypothetical protein
VPAKIPEIRLCTFTCTSSDGYQNAEITVLLGFEEWHTTIQGPLQSRGWVLQERQLSPRILHFTKSRLLCECNSSVASADRPVMEDKLIMASQQGVVNFKRLSDYEPG